MESSSQDLITRLTARLTELERSNAHLSGKLGDLQTERIPADEKIIPFAPATFDSSLPGTPAVGATGTNGADGVDAFSLSSDGIGLHAVGGGASPSQPVIPAGLYVEGGPPRPTPPNPPSANVGIFTTSDTGDAIRATSGGANLDEGHGVRGLADGVGVGGYSSNGLGLGVYGQASQGIGVGGVSVTGRGVYGQSTQGDGVTGASVSGTGVTGGSVSGTGVLAETSSDNSYAMNARNSGGRNSGGVVGDGGNGDGVSGITASKDKVGVVGRNDSTAPTDAPRGSGVFGLAYAPGATGVFGANNGDGKMSDGSIVGRGVQGNGPEAGVGGFSPGGIGVMGQSNTGTGIYASTSTGGTSVYSRNYGNGNGVFSYSDHGISVIGQSGPTSTGFARIGVLGLCPPGGFAGYFEGNVEVLGSFFKSGGGFQIDHPGDPEHKYLSHSFVESSEMKNIYDGTIILDAQGEAEVSLPPWFDALNTEFRYQLTPIGDSSPNLHIATEISKRHFKIAGGKPDMKVCWQVTGIRQDAWAKAHRIPVEHDKPEQEQSYYRHPEFYGKADEKGILRAYHFQPKI